MTVRQGCMTGSSAVKTIYAGRDPGRTCSGCRFYDESPGADLAFCRRHKIRTGFAASCRDFDGKTISMSHRVMVRAEHKVSSGDTVYRD